ncbi:MAG: EVE domain-containing protein [Sporomusaceae bacterium]|nr:EVE domain-containing protein [Sporomusaceae bacterium]
MNYYLVKTEPTVFSYDDLERLGQDRWDGVRNFTALKYMKLMKPGDKAFLYHTGKEKAIIGVIEITSEPYTDPNEEDPRWIVVDTRPCYKLAEPVSLKAIKASPIFSDWLLTTSSRLSVMPVKEEYWRVVHQMAQTPPEK